MSNFAKDVFADLKESRLWPLAIVLVIALVAVPVVLSKGGGEAAPAPATPALSSPSSLSEFQPIVSVTGASETKERKSVSRLTRKNPFEPLVKPKTAAAAGSGSGTSGSSAGLGGIGTQEGGSGTTVGGGSGTVGGGTVPPSGGTGTGSDGDSSEQKFFTYVAKIRFGELGKAEAKTVQRFRSLPSSDNPVVIFLGATTSGDTAVFMVSDAAEVTGEGTCQPDTDDCEFLYMKDGDTATIEAADAKGAPVTYELELRTIEAKAIDDPTKSANSSSHNEAGSKQASASKRSEARAKASVEPKQSKSEKKAREDAIFSLFDGFSF